MYTYRISSRTTRATQSPGLRPIKATHSTLSGGQVSPDCVLTHPNRPRPYESPWLISIALSLIFLLSSCGSDNTSVPQLVPTAAPVNGFGVAANHVHSLIALPNHVLILATHYGIFRSEDDGATWQEVAAGPNQPMQGLMTYSLSISPLDPQRMYVLTLQATIPHNGILGLYTSADQGHTWQLAITTAKLTSTSIFLVEAGNDTPNEVYIYLPELGASGLRISLDAGQHFAATSALPFGSILGLLAIPNVAKQLLVYGSDGMARSSDGGMHWQVFKNINGGIYDVTTAGPHSPIYASGDAGIFASEDGGKTFSLVNSQASYGSLAVSPVQPQVIYGKTGLDVYRSNDGGHIWQVLPHINGNLAVLAVDPSNACEVFLSLSYPTELYRLDQNGKGWLSLTPQT